VKESQLLTGQIKFAKISPNNTSEKDSARFRIVKRAAKEVKNGMNVNLGIGIPTLLPSVLPPEVHINLQS